MDGKICSKKGWECKRIVYDQKDCISRDIRQQEREEAAMREDEERLENDVWPACQPEKVADHIDRFKADVLHKLRLVQRHKSALCVSKAGDSCLYLGCHSKAVTGIDYGEEHMDISCLSHADVIWNHLEARMAGFP